jgi:Rieske Fe-S protein
VNPEDPYPDRTAVAGPVSPVRPQLISRRGALAAGVGGAGVLVLAGCSGSGGRATHGRRAADSDGTSDGSTARDDSSPSAKPTKSPHSQAAILTALADVEVGAAKSVTLADGAPAVVARPTATTAVCFSAVCTHMGCTVATSGAKLICPCHGSQFNAFTGAVLQGPAASPLPQIEVKVVRGSVLAV